MKKIVSFEKEFDFPSMIGEISSISIDHSLDFVDNATILGNIRVFGTYKMTEASTLEEEFTYDMPVDITLTEKVEIKDAKISIDDFYYEIKNDDILKCNIDILIDALEEITVEKEEEKVEEIEELKTENKEENLKEIDQKIKEDMLEDEISLRECDGDKKEDKEITVEKEKVIIEDNKEELEKEEKKEMKEDQTKNISSLFEVLNEAEETFTTYSIYILRKEDTIESVMDKYKITKEELSNYNDLNNLEIGSKIVIPTITNE